MKINFTISRQDEDTNASVGNLMSRVLDVVLEAFMKAGRTNGRMPVGRRTGYLHLLVEEKAAAR